jgi:hypothetical protein
VQDNFEEIQSGVKLLKLTNGGAEYEKTTILETRNSFTGILVENDTDNS